MLLARANCFASPPSGNLFAPGNAFPPRRPQKSFPRKRHPPRPFFSGGKRENLRSPRRRREFRGSRPVEGPRMRWSRGLPYRFRRTRAKSPRWGAPRAGPGRGVARLGAKLAARSARRWRMGPPTTRSAGGRFLGARPSPASLLTPCLLLAYSLPTPCQLLAYSLPTPCLRLACALLAPCLLLACSLPTPCLLLAYSLHTPCLLLAYALLAPCLRLA